MTKKLAKAALAVVAITALSSCGFIHTGESAVLSTAEKSAQTISKATDESLALPFVVESPIASPAEDFEYTVGEEDDGGIYIDSYVGDDEIVVIPAQIDGKDVISVSYGAFAYNETIKSVTVPFGVNYIGGYAFGECTALESVYLPESVAELGLMAFVNCTSLKTVVIPAGVTFMGESVFEGCTALEEAVLPEGLDSINSKAFSGCTALKSIYIPKGLKSVGNGAFAGCTGLSSITADKTNPDFTAEKNVLYSKDKRTLVLAPNVGESFVVPDFVYKIGDGAFYGAEKLSKITMLGNIGVIGESAFYGCTALETVDIPASVTTVSGNSFEACERLKAINIADNNSKYTSVDGVLFSKDKTVLVAFPAGKAVEYEIPEGTEEVGIYAFSGCKGLESVTIPDTVDFINNYAFYSCSGLKSVEIPGSVRVIGLFAFNGCEGISELILNEGISEIRDMSFFFVTGLDSVELPSSLTSVDKFAFPSRLNVTYLGSTMTWAEWIEYGDGLGNQA